MKQNDPFPVLVFSHGLQANPDIYLTITQHFASHGFIVAAVEHTDKSAIFAKTIKRGEVYDVEHDWITKNEMKNPDLEFAKRNRQLQHRVRGLIVVCIVSARLTPVRMLADTGSADGSQPRRG